LSVQIITGLFLAMNYVGEATLSFSSVDLYTRDIWSGWFVRSIHSKGASFFFFFIFLHIGRGLYYQSFMHTTTWLMGVVILLVSMAVAFLGYVLPWGQMSFWAATVITNFLSSIPYVGKILVIWIWGGYSVGGTTLTRFFALHFLLPFLVIVFVLGHKIFLHESGSNSPISLLSKGDKLKFHSYYSWKDVWGFFVFFCIFVVVSFFYEFFFWSRKFYWI